MKKFKMRFIALTLAAVTTLSMTGCGGNGAENPGASGTEDVSAKPAAKEWVYVPEFQDMSDEDASLYSSRFAGDGLYYSDYSYDEETGTSSQGIAKYSLTDGTVSRVKLPLEESTSSEDGTYSGQNIDSFAVQEDGSIIAIIRSYKSSMDSYESSMAIAKYDAEGNKVFESSLAEMLGADAENTYFRNILADSQGRLYLLGDGKIWLLGEDGKAAGAVDLGGGAGNLWINNSGVGKDGKVYVTYFDYNGNGSYVLAEIDYDKKAVGATYSNFPGGNSDTLSVGLEKDFLIHDGTAVYEYDLAAQSSEKLFDWLDSDINGSFVQAVKALEDGRIIAIIQDWSTNENSIALLTKTPGSEVVQKEQIVIGTLSGGYELQAAAVKFNRASDKYHVSIRQYIDYNNWTETSWNDAITKMNNELTSSSCPDIIDLSGVNTAQLAAKGVFEDMAPFLESSTALSKEDYLENVLDAYTYDGKLISVPAAFDLQTMIGRASDLGDKMGWSMQDLIAYADKNPDAVMFEGTQSMVMQYLMMYNEESFIDWSTGECSFESQDFKDILEFAKGFPKEYNWNEDSASEPTKIQRGEQLLANAYIYDFQQIQMYDEIFQGDYVCIGFPTADGSAGCAMNARNAYAITSKSKVKDAAWAFIESYQLGMQDENVRNYRGSSFSTNKKQLEKLAQEVVKVEYLTDENGNQILDENGEAIAIGGGSGIGYQDGWEYTFHIPTQEEVDRTMELIKAAKPVSSSNSEILNIINEEAAPFFEGQKTVDEVAKIIQSRIQIFVSENS